MRTCIMSVDMAVVRGYQGINLSLMKYSMLNVDAHSVLRMSDTFIVYDGVVCIIIKDRFDMFRGKVGFDNIHSLADVMRVTDTARGLSYGR